MPDLREDWHLFAQGHLNCPDCGLRVPVPIEAHIDEGQGMHLRPVLADVHAHAWTHTEGAADD